MNAKDPAPTPDSRSPRDPRATGRLSALTSPAEAISSPQPRETSRRFNRRLALAYILLAALWILLSDALVNALFTAPASRELAQTLKGLFFIISSGLLLYVLLRRHLAALHTVERQLVTRDAHIGRIIDTMANGVALIDLNGALVDVNPALCRLLHQPADALLGTTLGPLILLESRDTLTLNLALERARSRGTFAAELAYPSDNDRHVEVHLTLAPLFDDDGQLTGYVADFLNIGEVRRAEAHLEGIGAVIEELASENDIATLGDKALRAASDLTEFELGEIALFTPDSPTLRVFWSRGLTPSGDASARSALDFATHLVERGTFASRDLSDLSSTYRDQGVRHIAGVPIVRDEKACGALIVATRDPRRQLAPRHITMLNAVARQLGVALHRHALLLEARTSEARFRDVIDTVPDILYRTSLPDFATTFISPATERLLGYPARAFYEDTQLWRSRIHPDDRDVITHTIEHAIDHDETYVVRYRSIHRNDERTRWFEDRGHVERDANHNPIAITGVISDITAQKIAQDRLTFLAYNDSLTTLPNRHGLIEAIEAHIARNPDASAALFYVDLDRFHLVNDILGHDAGDALLLDARDRLQSLLPADAVLARIGADEFVVFMPSSDDLSLESHAHTIQSAFSRPFSIKGQDSFLSASIGIASYPRDAADATTLLKQAHRALSHAKDTGPANFSLYAGELAERQQRRLALQSQLHGAVERGELRVAYQPIIDLQSGRITGAEALLRWTDAHGQHISPAEFIPAAEESGLIVPLGDWVLERVCRQIATWHGRGLDVSVAVNLSPLQFLRSDIVDRILAAIANAKIPAHRLALELTESAILADPEHTARVVRQLRDHGLRVAIDDFGTGYSSLERLKQLPVQTLKIDRSFVKDLPGDERDTSIVRSIVTLSQSFSMHSLAEGIETLEQWHLLREMGCHYGQGFYFSPAIPPERLFEQATSPPAWAALPEPL
ncbi:EAL domain-containing protein [Lujinxingia vulgaris]|uniref:EAL domain-containing protein n=1 Tax=Lujinxingia vulgaris TaxID=2600176 RepID=A0A5C6X8V3_9DELT|nr:EAL domain-containing protein [Lujinxingia vulgaris]TXD37788.1 EAL domain-containing protein [Lujinxingia vulgaris]